MKNKERLLRGELIGLYIKVKTKRLEGKIIDETKNCFKIKTKNGIKMIPKSKNTFQYKDTEFKGDNILLRAEDRTKVRYKNDG